MHRNIFVVERLVNLAKKCILVVVAFAAKMYCIQIDFLLLVHSQTDNLFSSSCFFNANAVTRFFAYALSMSRVDTKNTIFKFKGRK